MVFASSAFLKNNSHLTKTLANSGVFTLKKGGPRLLRSLLVRYQKNKIDTNGNFPSAHALVIMASSKLRNKKNEISFSSTPSYSLLYSNRFRENATATIFKPIL